MVVPTSSYTLELKLVAPVVRVCTIEETCICTCIGIYESKLLLSVCPAVSCTDEVDEWIILHFLDGVSIVHHVDGELILTSLGNLTSLSVTVGQRTSHAVVAVNLRTYYAGSPEVICINVFLRNNLPVLVSLGCLECDGENRIIIYILIAVLECLCVFFSPTILIFGFEEHIANEVIAFFYNWSLRNGLNLELL